MAELSVHTSGVVMASLMFQHVNSDSDVEGVLIGNKRFDKQITLSDFPSETTKIEEIINIQRAIAFPKLNILYNNSLDVNLEEVQRVLGKEQQDRVVGWYRQRRNTEHSLSFKERIVHINLSKALSKPNIIFVLLTPNPLTANESTFKTDFSCFISNKRSFTKIRMVIDNLGLSDDESYWRIPVPWSSAGGNLTIKRHRTTFFYPNGRVREVREMSKMIDTMQRELQKASEKLLEKESRIEELQKEISFIKCKIEEKPSTSGETRELPSSSSETVQPEKMQVETATKSLDQPPMDVKKIGNVHTKHGPVEKIPNTRVLRPRQRPPPTEAQQEPEPPKCTRVLRERKMKKSYK